MKPIRIMSVLVLVSGLALSLVPSPLIADTCTSGRGDVCTCKGTCSAGPAECHCNAPPAT